MNSWRQRLLLLAGLAGVVTGLGFWPRGEPTQARSPLGAPAAQHHVQWPSAKNPIWSFYWVAPPDSTSPHGSYSGLELRHVFFKGKRVFWQANIPVINVLYDRGTTYRDWMNEYAPFQVNPIKTMCDHPGTADQGTFKGVAVENHPEYYRLTTQLRAGWYRYIQSWTFHKNGDLQPRFSFTVSNENPGMAANAHNHHAYYRFDFDIDGWPDDVIESFDGKAWHAITKETNQKHNAQHAKWRVLDKKKNLGYEVLPGAQDFAVPDAWSVADVWAVRYHGNEMDDGGASAAPGPHNSAHMNNLLNGEAMDGQDVVLWYRVGQRHAGHAGCSHLGPTLRPFGKW
jgi:hypothetical protein